MIRLSSIKLNPDNPRVIKDTKFLQLVENVRKYPKFLEKRPIVVASRENRQILGGNMRFAALKHLGYSEIPDQWVKFADDFTPEESLRNILSKFDDPDREGLRETPARYIKFLREFLNSPEFNFTVFDAEGYDQMIIQTNIPFYSLCEHHLAPFFGHGAIAYIPAGKIVGLSKLARVLDKFARRFQNQERITKQIAAYLMEQLEPQGVAVMLKAQHLCMTMRGVQKHDTWTATSELKGIFLNDQSCKNEFLQLIAKQ